MRIFPTALCTAGLEAEAKIARAAGFPVIVGGGDAARTVSLVNDAARHGAQCLISFGIAGALAPGLRRGDIVLSGHVIGDEREWRVESGFQRTIEILARRLGAFEGAVLGSTTIIASEREKALAWHGSGALAVDMESAAVADAAESAGVPFLVLRAIADTATQALPPAALIPLTAGGSPAIASVLIEVLRRPRQIPALVELARATRHALAALAVPARALHGALAAA